MLIITDTCNLLTLTRAFFRNTNSHQSLALSVMSSGGAYGTKASDTDFRKKWDKEEYAERAKKKDEEERERMKENEERMKQGEHATVMSHRTKPQQAWYRKEATESQEG